MKTYDVQAVTLQTNAEKAFEFIASPENLPKWTNAFKRADHQSALLVTPQGELPIKLRIESDQRVGNIDWIMTMPDGSVARAFSRVVPNGKNESIYSFVLMAPPVPLEHLEGALSEQMKTLRAELGHLQTLLARDQ